MRIFQKTGSYAHLPAFVLRSIVSASLSPITICLTIYNIVPCTINIYLVKSSCDEE
jgi:hypothetical protein